MEKLGRGWGGEANLRSGASAASEERSHGLAGGAAPLNARDARARSCAHATRSHSAPPDALAEPRTKRERCGGVYELNMRCMASAAGPAAAADGLCC